MLAEVRAIEPPRRRALPAVQAAAAAATGFVAGAAALALMRRHATRKLARSRLQRAVEALPIVGHAQLPDRHPPDRKAGGVSDGQYAVEVRTEVRPRWTFRLSRRVALDGLAPVRRRRRSTACCTTATRRCSSGSPSWAPTGSCSAPAPPRASSRSGGSSGCAARWASTPTCAPSTSGFASIPLIGPAVRANPGLRIAGRPDPFEALVWSVCEQLIEYERAAHHRAPAGRPARPPLPADGPARLAPAAVVAAPGAGAAGLPRTDRDARPGAAPGGAGGRHRPRRPARPRSRGRLAAAAGDPRDRRRGRCRRWPSPARAASTSCRPAISAI